ncbi:hypothetical protein ANSO36C_67450 (plasmid) [Nostoc cf. commune SO-36]|uniref:Uncharacterized protein n=1 Tax=Nostoc cf. commune SO-36 TaxID=449208 RepID=A0ABM7ZCD2_NOSCO|nr:hypothetical protein [Nostoc commune]BDI20943.1 hypothetical protein ANSO36C_67450 [Nostoc cf. commune SO-36]
MKRPLEYFLASLNIAAAVAYPALDGQYSLVCRVLGVSCGLLYWKISPNIFEAINKLSSRRDELKKSVKRLNSELDILPRKIEDLTQSKQQELDGRESAIVTREKELEKQIEAANKVLAEREQELAQSVDDANSELEKDKQKFLEETDEAIAQYQSKIDLLESEIDELRSLLAQYEAPALPEGSSFEIILVRHCMELLLNKRVVCEFKGVALDPDGYVVARLKPQDGGQKAIEKWANYLHIEMELAEAPKFATLRGAVQIWLKPQEMVRLPSLPFDGEPPNPSLREAAPTPNPPSNPPNLRVIKTESYDNFAQSPVQQPFTPSSSQPNKEFDERLMGFVEPRAKLPPYGAIRQMERDWVGFLWCFYEPVVRNQKAIILRVWGYKSGDGDGFQSARSRLHQILKDAGITPKTRERTVSNE